MAMLEPATENLAPTYSSTIRQVTADPEQVLWAQARGRGRGRGRGERGRGRGDRYPRRIEDAPPPPRPGQKQQNYKSNLPEYFNHDKLGIARNSCFACAIPGHTFRNKGETQTDLVTNNACCYKGVKLFKTPCFKCGMGLHASQSCCGPLQQAIQALKAQQAGQNKPEKARGLGEELESHLSFHQLSGQFEEFLEENPNA